MIEGCIDRIENSRLKGWAFNPKHPSEKIKLELVAAGTVIGNFVADVFREDLRANGKGDGQCSFDFKLSRELLNLDESTFTIRVASTKQLISPRRTLIDIRKQLARISLYGCGIEIGALHNPLWVPDGVRVVYVDRMGGAELLKHYPNFNLQDIVLPDKVDDGETLLTFSDNSLDFVIANHMLEHCENPLGTIRSHLAKLKSGGVLFYTIPDMRFFLDCARELTTFEHLQIDDTEGPQSSRSSHYLEWAKTWCGIYSESECEAKAKYLNESNYSIHFHVWSLTSFHEFLLQARQYFNSNFSIECVHFNYNEIITVLRKK